jgi:hypothetical protein
MYAWLEDEAQKGLSLKGALVREKGMWLCTLFASECWFDNFKQQRSLHSCGQ